jgi:hypothetical protein
MAVSVIKSGPFNFIEKPFNKDRLFASIQNALEIARQEAIDAAQIKELYSRFQRLSERQHQVMERAVAFFFCACRGSAASPSTRARGRRTDLLQFVSRGRRCLVDRLKKRLAMRRSPSRRHTRHEPRDCDELGDGLAGRADRQI